MRSQRKSPKVWVSAVVAMLLYFVASASADPYIPPELVRVTTPVYKSDRDFAPMLGEYTYDVEWEGIPAATVKVVVENISGTYRIVTTAKTASVIDIFYKLRYRAEGLISSNWQPIRMVVDHRENSKVKHMQIDYSDNGEISVVREQKGKGSTSLRFNPKNFTLDPFSASFLARGVSWDRGVARTFDVFNGKTRYLMTLTATDRRVMEVGGTERDVWIIEPTVKNLSNPESKTKLRQAKIYLTADSRRDVVKIESDVFIGTVETELDEFIPSSEQPIDTRMAMTKKQVLLK